MFFGWSAIVGQDIRRDLKEIFHFVLCCVLCLGPRWFCGPCWFSYTLTDNGAVLSQRESCDIQQHHRKLIEVKDERARVI